MTAQVMVAPQAQQVQKKGGASKVLPPAPATADPLAAGTLKDPLAPPAAEAATAVAAPGKTVAVPVAIAPDEAAAPTKAATAKAATPARATAPAKAAGPEKAAAAVVAAPATAKAAKGESAA